jgi:hypothetical protein
MLRAAVRRGTLWKERVAGSLAQLQHPSSLGPRSWSALPEPAHDASEDDEQAAGHAADDEAHRRRLQEMGYAQGNWHAAPQPSRRRGRGSLPSAEQVAEQLKSRQGSGCSPPAPSSSSSSSSSQEKTLDWREVVAAMRAAQRTPTGEEMLTDTFG